MSKVSGVISRQVLPACGLVALFVYSALSSGQGQDNLSRGIRSSLLTFFPRNQNSFHEVLVRSFQLAFSLWNISLKEGPLPPSRRRSLFTLAMSMIVFSSKEYNIDHLVQSAKAVLRRERLIPTFS
ncbi:hypothetical protein glysoja_029274 [Glycine soja]|uniref:Uncharacterized protein n=1 Tax=Glycine soja TaxID=3848 RepID=A0A0B2QXP7_GLYSO|nr:hypothetical protein glysoja_029274 [Glycine soja]